MGQIHDLYFDGCLRCACTPVNWPWKNLLCQLRPAISFSVQLQIKIIYLNFRDIDRESESKNKDEVKDADIGSHRNKQVCLISSFFGLCTVQWKMKASPCFSFLYNVSFSFFNEIVIGGCEINLRKNWNGLASRWPWELQKRKKEVMELRGVLAKDAFVT